MNEMELQTTVSEWLVKDKLFPKDGIRHEVVIRDEKNTYHVDIAILDTERNEVISLIEVKNTTRPEAKNRGIEQLLKYQKVIGKPEIPMYLITPHSAVSDSNAIDIHQILPDGTSKKITISEFPSYKSLIINDKVSSKVVNKAAVKSAVDTFKIASWGLAFVVLIIFLLDVTKVLELTTKQLLLGAIISGLILLPYATKLKMLGIEFERHIEKDSS